MPALLRDFETKSTLSLPDVGAWRYATHHTTDVWCCSFCVDDGPVKLWIPGDPVPIEWIEAAQNPDWVVSAFNDYFERQIEAHIMGPRYGWPIVPIERHRCLQASALALALPGRLEKVAPALSLPQQKDMNGHRLMLAMSKPRKARKDEDPGVYWDDDLTRLKRLYIYGLQDGAVEQALHARVGFISPEEQAVWLLDQRINDRGIYIDAALARGAIKIAEAARATINAELHKITGGEVATIDQKEKLIAWVSAHGCLIANLQKGTISHALTQKNIPPEARRVLELRQAGAHAAASKYETMLDRRAEDGRVRGCFTYHGCSTGRWSSHGVQVQNLKKQSSIDAIAAVTAGDLAQPLAVVGGVVRAAICA
jgi:DNA polymerase bacteriophage-type